MFGRNKYFVFWIELSNPHPLNNDIPDDFDSQLQNAINSNIERGMSGESEFNYGFQQGIKYVLEYLQ